MTKRARIHEPSVARRPLGAAQPCACVERPSVAVGNPCAVQQAQQRRPFLVQLRAARPLKLLEAFASGLLGDEPDFDAATGECIDLDLAGDVEVVHQFESFPYRVARVAQPWLRKIIVLERGPRSPARRVRSSDRAQCPRNRGRRASSNRANAGSAAAGRISARYCDAARVWVDHAVDLRPRLVHAAVDHEPGVVDPQPVGSSMMVPSLPIFTSVEAVISSNTILGVDQQVLGAGHRAEKCL